MKNYKGITIKVDNMDNIRSDFPCLVHYNVQKLYREYEFEENNNPEINSYDDFCCIILCQRFRHFINEYGFPVNEQYLKECRKLANTYYGENETNYIIYFQYAFNYTIPEETYMVLTLDELAYLEALHNVISSWLGRDIYPGIQIIR